MGIDIRKLSNCTRNEPVLDLLHRSDLVGKGRVEDVALDPSREMVASNGQKFRLRRAVAHFKFDRIYKGANPAATIEYVFDTIELLFGPKSPPIFPPPLMSAGDYALLFLRKSANGFEFANCYDPKRDPFAEYFQARMDASPLLVGESESTEPIELLLSDFLAGLADGNRETRLSLLNHIGNVRCRRAIYHLRKLMPTTDKELCAIVLLALIRCGDANALEEFAEFCKHNCCACAQHPSHKKINENNNGFSSLVTAASEEFRNLKGSSWKLGLGKTLALCDDHLFYKALEALNAFPPAERIPHLIPALEGPYRSIVISELQNHIPGITDCQVDSCGCGPDGNDWPQAVNAWLSWWENSGKQKYAPSPG